MLYFEVKANHQELILGGVNKTRSFENQFDRLCVLKRLKTKTTKESNKDEDIAHGTSQCENDSLHGSEVLRYTDSQRETILAVLNEGELDQLRNYKLAKFRVQNLLRYRVQNGQFHRVEDVLEVDGFGMRILQLFCHNVVNSLASTSSIDSVESVHPSSVKKCALCDTGLPSDLKKRFQSVLAVQHHPKVASWSAMNKDFSVTSWNYVPLTTRLRIYDHIHNFRFAHEIESKLPTADVYLMDQHKFQQTSRTAVSALRVVVQIEAVLFSLLMERVNGCAKVGIEDDEASGKNNDACIMTVKRDAVNKFFVQEYNAKKISAPQLVEKLVQDGRFRVDSTLWDWYRGQDVFVQSHLAACALKCFAFLKTEMENG